MNATQVPTAMASSSIAKEKRSPKKPEKAKAEKKPTFKKGEFAVSTLFGKQMVTGWTLGGVGLSKMNDWYFLNNLGSGLMIAQVKSYKKARVMAEIIVNETEDTAPYVFRETLTEYEDGTKATAKDVLGQVHDYIRTLDESGLRSLLDAVTLATLATQDQKEQPSE